MMALGWWLPSDASAYRDAQIAMAMSASYQFKVAWIVKFCDVNFRIQTTVYKLLCLANIVWKCLLVR